MLSRAFGEQTLTAIVPPAAGHRRVKQESFFRTALLLIALRALEPRGTNAAWFQGQYSLADEGSASMISMQYTVLVANQGRRIGASHRIDLPKHLAEVKGSDQEMSDLFHFLAQKYHHDVLAHGRFKCLACGDQANPFTNHPIQTHGEILDFLFPICSRGFCEIMGSQLRKDTVHQALSRVGFGTTLLESSSWSLQAALHRLQQDRSDTSMWQVHACTIL